MKFQKAAMFGLDARIALAIFGALSIISGAALYAVIQDVRVTVLHQEILEVEKAIEQYMFDTGQHLPVTHVVARSHLNRDVRSLFVDQGASGWKGPYLKTSLANTYDGFNVMYSNSVSSNTSMELQYFNPSRGECVSGDICYYWIYMNNLPLLMVQQINVIVDGAGESNPQNGNVAYYTSDNVLSSIYYNTGIVISSNWPN